MKNIMKPPTLDDAFTAATAYAEETMHNKGHMPPTIFMVDGHGTRLLFVADSLPDDEAKARLDDIIQLLCIAHAATVVVLALEIWRAPMDAHEDPRHFVVSEQPDRTECVLLMGEAPGVRKQVYLPIVCFDNAKFAGFGAPEEQSDDLVGRFTRLLPPSTPSVVMQTAARSMLQTQNGKLALRPPPGITTGPRSR